MLFIGVCELSMLPVGGFAGMLEITITTSIVRQVSVYKTGTLLYELLFFPVYFAYENFWKAAAHVVACIENNKKYTTKME